MKRLLLFILFLMTLTFGFSQNLIITEIADPDDNTSCRYVEIYNPTSSAIDLSAEGFGLQRWTNGNGSPQTAVDLTGTIAAGGFYIVCNNATSFNGCYTPVTCDQAIGTGGPADSNGDDHIAIVDCDGNVVDLFGNPGTDGTGTWHEFEDGRAERVSTVCTSEPTPDQSANWDMCSDANQSGCGAVNVGDPELTPGTWAGSASCTGQTYVGCSSGCTDPTPMGTATFDIQMDLMTEAEAEAAPASFHNAIMNCPAGFTYEAAYGELADDGDGNNATGVINGLYDEAGNAVSATYEIGEVDPTCSGNGLTTTLTSGTISTGSNMQDGSPKPTNLFSTHYTENAGSGSLLNAMKVTFPTPVNNFGIFLGDVESSTQGTLAEIWAFDAGGNLIATEIMDPVANGPITNESGCGAAQGDMNCGNQTTTWIGITNASSPIACVLIVVGDDDACAVTTACDGGTEHLSFGGVTVGGECVLPLPITLASFHLYPDEDKKQIDLTWRTASEENNEYFSIERSLDGIDFIEIGKIDGAGTTSQPTAYFFEDKNVSSGLYYYRLKQVDFDGAYTYSDILNATLRGDDDIFIFPNPTKDIISIQPQKDLERDANFEIINMQGQVVLTSILKKGESGLELNLSDFPTGVYYLRLMLNNELMMKKILKQ